MQKLMKKSALGLMVAGLLSSSLAMQPAEARSSHSRGRELIIGAAVIGVIALVSHHKNNNSSTSTMTTSTKTKGMAWAATGATPATTAH
ncbi:MAG: hypothetical protein JOZ57_01645 [Abitibacteriaceae bacterium]|nr:hypothetical protein [Abditibacteriaceae bacterium]